MSVEYPEKFLNFESDYIACRCGLNNSINIILQTDETPESIHEAEQNAQLNIVEAQRFIKMMMVESRSKDFVTKRAMNDKINRYRDELSGMKKDYERASLLGKERLRNTNNVRGDSISYRERLERTTDRLKKSSSALESSRKIVSETEEIGISVLDNLSQQRETLLASHEKVKSTREYTGDAHRLLKNMTRKMLANKIILWTTIAILIICIVLVFYYDFIHSSK